MRRLSQVFSVKVWLKSKRLNFSCERYCVSLGKSIRQRIRMPVGLVLFLCLLLYTRLNPFITHGLHTCDNYTRPLPNSSFSLLLFANGRISARGPIVVVVVVFFQIKFLFTNPQLISKNNMQFCNATSFIFSNKPNILKPGTLFYSGLCSVVITIPKRILLTLQ